MKRRKLHLTYTRQLVVNLLLLGLQLLGIRKLLPLATSADAEVYAHRLLSHSTLLNEAHHTSLHVTVFLFDNLKVNHITRNHERHKDNLLAHMRHTLSFGCHTLYLNLLKQG